MYLLDSEGHQSKAELSNRSKKDDSLFAMRAKSGEKAERLVARHLQDSYGHSFGNERVHSPGVFQIRYIGKRVRQPDLHCKACGLRFEVKKRNWDDLLRVSHSQSRPFASENRDGDWHAFVFSDMTIHFVSNRTILAEISSGHSKVGADRYDSWIELDKRDQFVFLRQVVGFET